MIDLEQALAVRKVVEIQHHIIAAERKYLIPSDDFCTRYEAGQLKDSADFMAWGYSLSRLHVQVLTENGQAKFAVIPFAAFEELRALLADEEKLADYLDYLHIQTVKAQQPARLKVAEVKAALALD